MFKILMQSTVWLFCILAVTISLTAAEPASGPEGPPAAPGGHAPTLAIAVKAKPDDVAEPLGEVTFRVKIKNEGETPLSLVSVMDSIYLDQATGELPRMLAPGAVWEHSYLGVVEGKAGDVHESTVTVTALKPDGGRMEAQSTARVLIKTAEEMEVEPEDDVEMVMGAVVGDRVWHDLNGDGIQGESEPGLAGVTVRLRTPQSEAPLAEVVSGADGGYRFEGNFPRKVYLEAVAPEGHAFTWRRTGDDRTLDSDIDPVTGRSRDINLSETEDDGHAWSHATEWDIGVVNAETVVEAAGVVGSGYWRNHQETWPVETLKIGDIEYSKEQALPLMTGGADKSYLLFRELATALLNIAAGAPDACIKGSVEEAQIWATSNPPGSDVRDGEAEWQESGKALKDRLEEYNGGELCAPKRPESAAPVSVAAGISRKGTPAEGFKIRASAEAGRLVMLQKSYDMVTWVDVKLLQLDYGVLEFQDPDFTREANAFYRLVPQAVQDRGPRQRGPFLQLESGRTEALQPWVYEGDLEILGNNNQVTGTTDDAGAGTIVAGDLIIRGNDNTISRLRVMGDLIIRGNANLLLEVDVEGEVTNSGAGNEY